MSDQHSWPRLEPRGVGSAPTPRFRQGLLRPTAGAAAWVLILLLAGCARGSVDDGASQDDAAESASAGDVCREVLAGGSSTSSAYESSDDGTPTLVGPTGPEDDSAAAYADQLAGLAALLRQSNQPLLQAYPARLDAAIEELRSVSPDQEQAAAVRAVTVVAEVRAACADVVLREEPGSPS